MIATHPSGVIAIGIDLLFDRHLHKYGVFYRVTHAYSVIRPRQSNYLVFYNRTFAYDRAVNLDNLDDCVGHNLGVISTSSPYQR